MNYRLHVVDLRFEHSLDITEKEQSIACVESRDLLLECVVDHLRIFINFLKFGKN